MNNVEKDGDTKAEKILTELEAGDESEVNPENPELSEDLSNDAVKQIEMYKEQLLRRAAEFENYKRRTENEISSITRFANEYLISDLLPIVDDLQRSLVAGKENNDYNSFYKGIEFIYSKLVKIFEQKGLKPIEALNKPFDVNFHEAMMTMPKEGVEPHIVIQELEKGYLLFDKVIRHTKVIVSAENNGGLA
jgi:molecular chaperone GrpE